MNDPKGFDKFLIGGMILIELQNTFETFDHDILLQKLNAIRDFPELCIF